MVRPQAVEWPMVNLNPVHNTFHGDAGQSSEGGARPKTKHASPLLWGFFVAIVLVLIFLFVTAVTLWLSGKGGL